MKKLYLVITALLLFAFGLAACSPATNQSQTPGPNAGTPGAGTNPIVTPQATVGPTAGALATSGVPAGTQTANMLDEHNPRLVSNVIGYELKDKNSNDLGEIESLVVDRNSGTLEYAVVGAGGFLGIGEEKILVPWSAFQVNPQANSNNDNTNNNNNNSNNTQPIALTVDTSVLKNAPTVAKSGLDLSQLATAGKDWDSNIRAYWTDKLNALPVTGAEASKAAPVLLSDVTDVNVVNKKGDDLGDIENMVLSKQGDKIEYAILAAGGALDLGERLIPIPYSAFKFDKSSDQYVLTLNVDQSKLKNAPYYQNMNEFPNINVQNWDNKIKSFWNNLTS